MRISDWSSDVCSSDLPGDDSSRRVAPNGHRAPAAGNGDQVVPSYSDPAAGRLDGAVPTRARTSASYLFRASIICPAMESPFTGSSAPTRCRVAVSPVSEPRSTVGRLAGMPDGMKTAGARTAGWDEIGRAHV